MGNIVNSGNFSIHKLWRKYLKLKVSIGGCLVAQLIREAGPNLLHELVHAPHLARGEDGSEGGPEGNTKFRFLKN